ncbi:hypothetical protein KDU71_07735 [Carboxylicivirga sediminis]|uniref:Uncharacterized protein n=1 Tax=Carboxylicivirga sediminis TaxID=2006564 RepID=A0A941F297_9BACT|nr:hypothetical protein [Carboxylicivirga sediminis]MBR8535446.1 hypothetical protein [Carboxylicivirga sediminis]
MRPEEILSKFLDELGVSASELAEKLGYERAEKLYKILRGQAKSISVQIQEDILRVYPGTNKLFLLTGEGEVFKREFNNNKIGNYIESHVGDINTQVFEELIEISKDIKSIPDDKDELNRIIHGMSDESHSGLKILLATIKRLEKELDVKDEIIKSKDEIIQSKNEIIELLKNK